MIKLWLDDLRIPRSDYVWVKNYNEFIDFISKHELPDYMSLDHDLGEDKTGYDCLKWLINYCMDNELRLPKCNVHSMNPVGKINMLSLIDNFNKIKNDVK